MISTNIKDNVVSRTINSTIPFLARDSLYSTEKPYGADFPVDSIEGASITNHVFDNVPITFHDVRELDVPLELELNGSCFLKAETSLLAEHATGKMSEAMAKYIAEVIDIIKRNFPQYVEVKYTDYQVRKRSPAFPDEHGKTVDFAQPAAIPHTDFSNTGAWRRMKDVFPDRGHYEERKFDLINVWKVLKGPNNDWPLAVCDFTTVNIAEDITTNDALHPMGVGENWLLYHSDKQRWYYLSDMDVSDMLVFRNTDSEGKLSRCFHAAFRNPLSGSELRESVEVRLVAFRS